MAEEMTNDVQSKQADVTADKAAKDSKKASGKKNKPKFTERVKKFFRDYKSEFKKIVWPAFGTNTKNTGVVIVVLVISGVVVGLLDLAFNKGILWLGSLY